MMTPRNHNGLASSHAGDRAGAVQPVPPATFPASARFASSRAATLPGGFGHRGAFPGALQDRLAQAREHAFNGGIPIRRKDGKLYALLAECLSICEEVIAEGMFEELRQLARVSVNERRPRGEVTRDESNNGKGRRYVEARSDAYILVARYVLAGVDERNSYYRYATTLREAGKRQIAAKDLVDWLNENGGVNALYRPTTLKSDSNQTKQLHLNQRITFPRDGAFTITLRHDGKGFFDVVQA